MLLAQGCPLIPRALSFNLATWKLFINIGKGSCFKVIYLLVRKVRQTAQRANIRQGQSLAFKSSVRSQA